MKDNQKIKVLIGISGSGKSSWCTNYIKENPTYVRVNRDSYRNMITSTDSRFLEKFLEDLITKFQHENIRTILHSGYNVIIDNTHLNKKYLDEILIKYNHFADIEFIFIEENKEVCYNRVRNRDVIPNPDYIFKQYDQFLNIKNLNITKYNPKIDIKVKYNSELDSCIICDLDGTLSLFDSKIKSSYDRDFENDNVNEAISRYIEEISMWHHNEDQSFKIFFFSGRNSKHRNKTIQFLNSCLDSDVKYTLIMRDEQDQRRDSIIKLEMFEKYIRDRYNVEVIFDDRLQVIEECWEKLGVFVFNCNQGNKRY